MPNIIEDYREALERLKKGRPINVRKGIPISNDSVSLEAGRKKGTIKRSRPIFAKLITEIDAAAREQPNPKDAQEARIRALRADVQRYRNLWEEALTREVCLLKQLWDERKEWAKEKEALTGEKVASLHIRRANRTGRSDR